MRACKRTHTLTVQIPYCFNISIVYCRLQWDFKKKSWYLTETLLTTLLLCELWKRHGDKKHFSVFLKASVTTHPRNLACSFQWPFPPRKVNNQTRRRHIKIILLVATAASPALFSSHKGTKHQFDITWSCRTIHLWSGMKYIKSLKWKLLLLRSVSHSGSAAGHPVLRPVRLWLPSRKRWIAPAYRTSSPAMVLQAFNQPAARYTRFLIMAESFTAVAVATSKEIWDNSIFYHYHLQCDITKQMSKM